MKKYMVENHSDWLEFAEGLGMDVVLQDLYLVTGTDRTDEWAMAVFRHTESETAASASITIPKGLNVSASFRVTWDATASVLHHYGPYRRLETSGLGIGCSPSEGGSLHNQTVFIRGFRMKKRAKWIAPKVIRAAAGYHNIEFDREDDDQSSVLSPKSDHSSDNDVEAVRDVAKETNPVCDILDYILESCPGAEVAIAHDRDLCYYTHDRHDSIGDEPSSIRPEASQMITLNDGVASFGGLSETTFSAHTGLNAQGCALSSPAVSIENTCSSTPLQTAEDREHPLLEHYSSLLTHDGNASPSSNDISVSNIIDKKPSDDSVDAIMAVLNASGYGLDDNLGLSDDLSSLNETPPDSMESIEWESMLSIDSPVGCDTSAFYCTPQDTKSCSSWTHLDPDNRPPQPYDEQIQGVETWPHVHSDPAYYDYGQ
ncbi:hypothetical protein NEOLEDRAFT_1103928 [Neolentinus lepideus HHB14362 ss-1]|uniref:Uncharacterized protein n=1 Tax=Neolentinus lepideus HHB14362 ss-1 TaxID=1314782 RepID=A0A165KIM3_9AGAM|nr:hypothetical protein NEOLEDRAFT_1103928 [Neolentinus lepideus HHB14362 ss-1]